MHLQAAGQRRSRLVSNVRIVNATYPEGKAVEYNALEFAVTSYWYEKRRNLIEIKIEQCLVINLPAEKIFDYMADGENLVEWSSVVVAVRKTSPGMISVGATWRFTTRFLGRWLETTYELVEHEPGHCFTLKSISGLFPAIFSYRLEAIENGRTNVSVEAVIYHVEEFLGLEEPVVVNTVQRQMEGDLLTLRDILEARTTITNSSAIGK